MIPRVPSAIRRPTVSLVLATVVIAGAACDDLFGGSDLVLALTVSDTTVGPDRPITVMLTATSTGEAVVWGQGSSSCQLTAVARVDGEDRSIDLRGCTDDLVLQGVVGGEAHAEQWQWNGVTVVNGVYDTLPTGRYRLYALAGDKERSGGASVRVERE